MTERHEDIKQMIKDADLCDLHYDEDAYDIYKSQDYWILCQVSVAADPVVGHVLANAPRWVNTLLTKNEILESKGTSYKSEVDRLRKALEEAYDRLITNQPLALGFILEDALKEIKEEVES